MIREKKRANSNQTQSLRNCLQVHILMYIRD